MEHLFLLLFALSVSGLLGMTWLFPLLARLFWRRADVLPEATPVPRKVAVLIPAHDEERVIGRTLATVTAAARRAEQEFPGLSVEVVTCADGCHDDTARVARAAGSRVTEHPVGLGKWRTLLGLFDTVPDADWIVFADAGVVWPEDLLYRLVPFMTDARVMGVAPAYRNPAGGLVEQFVWWFERHFKALEGFAGGPVSIHGATVCYRAAELGEAFAFLSRSVWLNDDVVLPLVLRSRFPDKEIRYVSGVSVFDLPAPAVPGETLPGEALPGETLPGETPATNGPADNGPAAGTVRSGTVGSGVVGSGAAERIPDGQEFLPLLREFGRRRRMVLGNVQWIQEPFWRRNGLVFVLALRRVFRVFWAYWIGVLVLGVAVVLADSSLRGRSVLTSMGSGDLPPAAQGILLTAVATLTCLAVAGAVGMRTSIGVRRAVRSLLGVGLRVADAAGASLLAPFFLIRSVRLERAGWK